MYHAAVHLAQSAQTAQTLAPIGTDAELVTFDVPELEHPVHLGQAIAIVYRGDDDQEYFHEFQSDAQLLVDDGIAVVVAPGLELTDLGLTETE